MGRIPATRSGRASIGTMSDEEALSLRVSDVVIVPWPSGLSPRAVLGVRMGVAGEDGGEHAVPVLDLVRVTAGAHQPLAFAIPDVCTIELSHAEACDSILTPADVVAGITTKPCNCGVDRGTR